MRGNGRGIKKIEEGVERDNRVGERRCIRFIGGLRTERDDHKRG